MRIATFNSYEGVITNLQSRQRGLQNSQEQLTSGKRVSKPSDDPVAAARAERALAEVTRADAHQRALEAARTNTKLTESALGDAGELIQQAREAIVSAGNASYTDKERQNLVNSLTLVRQQLLSVANRSDGTGGYLFGGQGGAQRPFRDDADGVGVVYQGETGNAMVASDEQLSTHLDGRQVWLQATAADGTNSLSLFDVVDTAIAALGAGNISDVDRKAAVSSGLAELDRFNDHLLAVRASSGGSLNRMDSVELRIADSKLASETERSNAEDLDLVQAISDFQSRQTGYDAALKAYSMVQRMSLFNYIGG